MLFEGTFRLCCLNADFVHVCPIENAAKRGKSPIFGGHAWLVFQSLFVNFEKTSSWTKLIWLQKKIWLRLKASFELIAQ